MPIEQVSPELERIVSLDQEVEVLSAGYAVAEGPLWWKESQHLLFSEVRGGRRWKWSAEEGVTLVQDPTNNANGLTRDPPQIQLRHPATKEIESSSDRLPLIGSAFPCAGYAVAEGPV